MHHKVQRYKALHPKMRITGLLNCLDHPARHFGGSIRTCGSQWGMPTCGCCYCRKGPVGFSRNIQQSVFHYGTRHTIVNWCLTWKCKTSSWTCGSQLDINSLPVPVGVQGAEIKHTIGRKLELSTGRCCLSSSLCNSSSHWLSIHVFFKFQSCSKAFLI